MLCKEFFRLLFVVANFLQFLKACTIPGISGNPGFLRLTVKDIHRGVFHRVTTSNILSITGSSHTGDPMQNGPYITAELDDNDLILSLHDNFEHYEEYETALSMGFTINFSCDGNPNTAIVVLTLNVEDTNNNKPIFTPPDVSFLIVPPLAPGFKITGCNNQIVVRDIDLTTTGIKFEIEENDYFEIAFDEESTIPNTKTFLGILRTKSIIRSIPNPISLQITATDIDNTNDPPLTSSTTVTIEGDPSFSLPDDLIFTEPFYLAFYSADHEVNLKQKISLQEGFDDKVTFHLTGELVNHFRLNDAGNNLTIEVSTPLPESVFNEENQVLLVVTAERQHVSPTSATIVIELPRPKTIEFESLHYDARIVDNSLKAPNLVLAQGYEDGFDINIISDYSSNFQYEIVERNQIRLQMTPLSDDILINNNFITLHVVASSGGSSATALVTLDIIKDDLTTPMFEENTYIGAYNSEDGLDFEVIILVQGYDDTVNFDTEGEHGDFFTISSNDNRITLVPKIPTEALQTHNQLIFVIHATKPRTVGARSTVIVNLPSVSEEILRFANNHYMGLLEEGTLVTEEIVLEEGYADDVNFNIFGDLQEHFLISNEANIIELKINPENEIPNNLDFIVLEIVANRPNIKSASTIIVIDIMSENKLIPIPMFRKIYYDGIYTSSNGLEFDHVIDLEHGYDEHVSFTLDRDAPNWFEISNNGNDVQLLVPNGIPMDVLKNNTHFTFSIIATRVDTLPGRTAVVIALPDTSELTILKFQKSHYSGSLQDHELNIEGIVLSKGHNEHISFEFSGEHQSFFQLNTNNAPVLYLELIESIPETLDTLILLEIRAFGPNAVSAFTTVVLETPAQVAVDVLTFSEAYYSGSYTQEDGLDFTDIIKLSSGYDDSVIFDLDGTHSEYFKINRDGNSVTLLVIPDGIPISVLNNNQHLTLSIIADRPGAVTGRAAIVISLPDEFPNIAILQFEQTTYRGFVEENELSLGPIILQDGFSENINFELSGEHYSMFSLNTDDAPSLSLELINPIPESLDGLILLEIRAFGLNAVSAFTTVVLETPAQVAVDVLTFSEAYYSGSYTQEDGLDFTDIIKLSSGYDDSVIFDLDGTHSEYFKINRDGNSVTLLVIPDGIPISVLNNNQHLTLSIKAERPGAVTGRAAIVISLPDEFPNIAILQFEQTTYRGFVEENELSLGPIILQDGFSENINFELSGEHYSMFSLNTDDAPSLSLELINPIPESLDGLILLEIRAFGLNAVSAFTTVVLETPAQVAVDVLTFSEAYYSGSYTQEDGLDFTDIIKLSSGYDDSVIFDLDGTHSEYFKINRDGNSVTLLVIPDGIPISVLNNNQHLTLSIIADRPGAVTGRAAIVISLPDGPPTDVFFMSALYRGTLELGVLRHDDITLVGYTGSEIEIYGEWSHLFTALVIDEDVTIKAVEDIIVPTEVQHIAFQLRADVARTAITISIQHRDVTIPPEVEFRPTSYVFRVDITETGIIGIVTAIANNGENVEFSLEIDNEHLAERLSVNSQGELQLSAPANSGRYHFNVIATTIASGVSATANAQLTVDAITVCGEDEFVLPPLIVIERDEEEAHDDLVVVNDDIIEKCYFEMVNHWPIDQSWLTVNNTGLHAKSIDREDRSIAFMTVSQIQVELILHCADDNVKRTRRSVLNNNSNVSKTITPFEYGPKRWVLAESILYNSRRSFVNLIVKDINDHYPIFIGKENEPIVVGYPKLDLVDVIRPRALAELKATDKDIDINAKLLYWSNEPVLAVAGETGRVHVRNNMAHLLEDNAEYVVSATDKAGAEDGKVGSVKILVKLLDINNIAVLTIRDAFMDSEQAVLRELSKNLNYDVRPLRSTVISSEFEESKQAYQIKHDIKRESITNSSGASLQLYVYGLVDRMPITASQLLTDINNSGITTIRIVDSVILEDHIANSDCRINIGLFAATITLSIILFLIIVFAVFWYFYKIRKFNNYEQFSDTKSLSTHSNDDSEIRKVEGIARAKINIDEIKKSERRLQEILNTPVEDTNITPQSNKDISTETIIDIPVVEKNAPIVIQSIDKLKDANDSSDEEDEFGEIKNSPKRRKSVVTFNENVEKIIHVEDDIDDTDSVPDFEVDKL